MIFFSAEYFKFGLTGWPELGPDLHHVHNCEQVLANLFGNQHWGDIAIFLRWKTHE